MVVVVVIVVVVVVMVVLIAVIVICERPRDRIPTTRWKDVFRGKVS